MFVRFTGGGIGHKNTALPTNFFCEALLKLFGLNFNEDASYDQDINEPQANDGDNLEDDSDSDAREDSDTQSNIDDDIDSTDFEGDGGECGANEEDELGFGNF